MPRITTLWLHWISNELLKKNIYAWIFISYVYSSAANAVRLPLAFQVQRICFTKPKQRSVLRLGSYHILGPHVWLGLGSERQQHTSSLVTRCSPQMFPDFNQYHECPNITTNPQLLQAEIELQVVSIVGKFSAVSEHFAETSRHNILWLGKCSITRVDLQTSQQCLFLSLYQHVEHAHYGNINQLMFRYSAPSLNLGHLHTN